MLILDRFFVRLEAKSLFPDYAQQKELLDAFHRTRGIDAHVATYTPMQSQGGSVRTICTWTEGLTLLLPQTHFVTLVAKNEVVAAGEWGRLQEVVGHLMERADGLYPPRTRVTQFPSPSELAAIGKLATLKES